MYTFEQDSYIDVSLRTITCFYSPLPISRQSITEIDDPSRGSRNERRGLSTSCSDAIQRTYTNFLSEIGDSSLLPSRCTCSCGTALHKASNDGNRSGAFRVVRNQEDAARYKKETVLPIVRRDKPQMSLW